MDDSNSSIDEQMEMQTHMKGGTVECVGCGIPTHFNNAFWKTRSIVPDARLPVGMKAPRKVYMPDGRFAVIRAESLGKKYLKEHFCDRCSMLITGFIENLSTSNG